MTNHPNHSRSPQATALLDQLNAASADAARTFGHIAAHMGSDVTYQAPTPPREIDPGPNVGPPNGRAGHHVPAPTPKRTEPNVVASMGPRAHPLPPLHPAQRATHQRHREVARASQPTSRRGGCAARVPPPPASPRW